MTWENPPFSIGPMTNRKYIHLQMVDALLSCCFFFLGGGEVNSELVSIHIGCVDHKR